MATKSARILKDVEKARSEIHLTGVKGHDFTMGLMLSRTMAKYKIKHLLNSEGTAKKHIEDLTKAIAQHEIRKVENIQGDFNKKIIEEQAAFYGLSFTAYLLMWRALHRLNEYITKNKISEKVVKETIGKGLSMLHDNLKTEQQQLFALMKDIEGGKGFTLNVADLLYSKGSIMQYLSLLLKVKGAFRAEKRIEKVLKRSALKEKEGEMLKDNFLNEIYNLHWSILHVNLQLKHAAHMLLHDEELLKKAAQEHEIPLKMVEEEANIDISLIKLIHLTLHSLHIVQNQIFGYLKDNFRYAL